MANDWLSPRLADQAIMFENVNAKIAGYQAILPLTPAQATGIQLVCATFDAAYTYNEQFRATGLSTGQWRDLVLKGTPVGGLAPEPPTPPTPNMPVGAKIGVIAQFREYRDIILAAPGYTEAIGQDLMIVASHSGAGSGATPPDELAPSLKCQVGSGYEVSVAGAMHGMDAMRVEWQPNGSETWALVGFLTRTPGTVIITPTTPGQPVAGRLRARYIKNNVPVGNYSQEVALTVSQ